MLYKRKILEKIEKVIGREEFIIINGARQAGKTSALLMLKSSLEEKGEKCHYFNLENSEHLNLLNKHPYNIFELLPQSKTKQYVFIDEIQYLENPANFLKLNFDEKRNEIKIIASGSSSFYIDKKFQDSLAGRKFLFELGTLDFDEFLVFNKQEELIKQKGGKLSVYYEKIASDLWEKYLIYGGYPKVVLAESEEMKKILLEDIGTSYVKKDIADAGIKNSEKYFSLMKILACQTGQLVNSQEISATLGIARKTADEYLYVMSKSYQVAFIRPFWRNLRKELTKMPKVYFYDLGLRNFFLDDYSSFAKRRDQGQYLENAVFRELFFKFEDAGKIKFWRTQDKKEVDFVAGNEAYEIKFNFQKKKDQKKYAKFQEQYPEIKLNFLAYEDVLGKFYGI